MIELQKFKKFIYSQDIFLKNQKDAFEVSWKSKLSNPKNINFQEFQKNLKENKEIIKNIKQQVNIKELESLNNLKKQKRGRFKNLMIKVFTFGKVDKNKKIEQEIAKIKNEKSLFERISCKKFNDYLENKNSIVNTEMIERHNQVIKIQNELSQENERLRNKVENLKTEKMRLKWISNCFAIENYAHKEFQKNKNKENVDNFLIYQKMIDGKDKKIEFWKNNSQTNTSKLEKINSTDSGIEIGYEVKEMKNKETQTTEDNSNKSFKINQNSILNNNYPDEKNPFSEIYPKNLNPFTEENETLVM